jgi:uncharacterized protein YndB with AHSA1/START domain
MSMSEYAVVTSPRTVRIERLVKGPIERVWAYLTESDKRGTWLATGEMELRVGGRVDLTWRNSELSADRQPVPERFTKNEGQQMIGRITRCDPPKLLSFAWGEDVASSSEATFELTPRGGDVLLMVTHTRLPNRGQMVSVSGGWHIHLDMLADRLAGRESPNFWSSFVHLEDVYDKRTPAD